MADKENKIRYGLCNVHIAKATISDDGAYTYAVPFALPGAVSLSLKSSGKNSAFRADNMDYATFSSDSGFDGDLELADFPQQFYVDILGDELDAQGLLGDSKSPIINPFAILFEIEGDVKKRRYCYYNCTATRPTLDAKTSEEEIKPETMKSTISAKRRPDIGRSRVVTTLTTTDTVYNNWYTAVPEYGKAVA